MKRQKYESFSDYKDRRKKANKNLKIYLRGHLWWDSSNLGQYIRKN